MPDLPATHSPGVRGGWHNMLTSGEISNFNRHMYLGRRSAAAYVKYARRTGIKPAEATILSELKGEIKERAILDIGVGAGRTTPYLTELSRDYIGTDYSADMLAACGRQFPNVSFRRCDARDMSSFADGQFHLVFFSYNGIDSNGPEDRSKILREIHRILDEGGIFVFASLNRNKKTIRAYDWRNVRFTLNPIVMAGRIIRYPIGIWNQLQWKKYEVETEEYSLRNTYDTFHAYSILLYHIAPLQQKRQLSLHDFELMMVVNYDGQIVAPDAPDDSPEIYYVARKISAAAPELAPRGAQDTGKH
ncbi:MAG: methyltransferase domain-containing protein [Betaproteobacteria bacterium]|nr:MAG: methyltransferase domain-containing protein [Betaproteobacteria bacterium]